MGTTRAIKYAFTPEQVQAIHRAYDLTCAALGLSQAGDRMTEIVVKKVIELARSGEFDPERLSQWALEQLGGNARASRGIEPSERLKHLAEECVAIAAHTADTTAAAELLKVSLRLLQLACSEVARVREQMFDDDVSQRTVKGVH